MKYFFDTGFIDDGKTIDLISIGIVCEDGREYYAVNYDCDFSKANSWVQENVLIHLPKKPDVIEWEENTKYYQAQGWNSKSWISNQILCFIWNVSFQINPKKPDVVSIPEFWAYYADYDWVVFCQLFGTMMDLPKGFPMYCRDIKQECDRLGNPRLPEQKSTDHHALNDARWVRDSYLYLSELAKGENQWNLFD
jgi:3' exoribonuclease, RNase T-like